MSKINKKIYINKFIIISITSAFTTMIQIFSQIEITGKVNVGEVVVNNNLKFKLCILYF